MSINFVSDEGLCAFKATRELHTSKDKSRSSVLSDHAADQNQPRAYL